MLTCRTSFQLRIFPFTRLCNSLYMWQRSHQRSDHIQSDKSCQIIEQYLAYLITIKGCNKSTVLEYRLDLLQFFRYIVSTRDQEFSDVRFTDIAFIRSITLGDIYSLLPYCQDILQYSSGTKTWKIVFIRQFWKYLKTKAHLIDNNIV